MGGGQREPAVPGRDRKLGARVRVMATSGALTADGSSGTPLFNVTAPLWGRSRIEPTVGLSGPPSVWGAAPTFHTIPEASVPLPCHQRPRVPRFPHCTRVWAGHCFHCSRTLQLHLGPSDPPPPGPVHTHRPTSGPASASPPHPPQAANGIPDASHKRHSVVPAGPLNSACLCVLGRGCTGGGVAAPPRHQQ